MKIKTLTTLLFMTTFFTVTAQQNSYSLELNLKNVTTENINTNETEVGFSIIKTIDANNKITNTIKYKNTSIDYDQQRYNLQEDLNKYNRIENAFEFKHNVNDNTFVNMEVRPVASYEHDFDLSDISLLGGIELTHFFNLKNSLTVGAKRMDISGKATVLPTLSYFHKLSQNTFIDIGFPNSKISYSNNIRNTFNLTNSFNGSFYNLDQPKLLVNNSAATKVSLSQMSTVFEYERNIDINWFLTLKGGYEFNKKYILTDAKDNKVYDLNIDNGYLLNIGIKYKH